MHKFVCFINTSQVLIYLMNFPRQVFNKVTLYN